ncbi:MAG: 16S rRNA (guanine(527)-N(7))-methyltransferase RsmG [Pyrinomonadaceae bacterium]
MNNELVTALRTHQAEFGVELSDEAIKRLDFYYEGVMKNNELLHLVGKSTPKEFALRHILESLFALQFLPNKAYFADLGTGAGLPGIPCLIVREDLRGILIESKQKKTDFLNKAVRLLQIKSRTEVLLSQFDEAPNPGVSHVMCRAIDGFSKKVPRILRWAPEANVILFAGNNVKSVLKRDKVKVEEKLIPNSEQRFIYFIERNVNDVQPEVATPHQT